MTKCETCNFYNYDEEYGDYVCYMDLDEDEMARFLSSDVNSCPFWRPGDEYRTARRQSGGYFMDIRAVFDRVSLRDPAPDSFSLLIEGSRGKLLSMLSTPGGKGLHPAVVLSHGYPGNEQNMDLVQFLRALGFAVLTYHYSGSWGSDGDFSFRNCIEDANTVLDHLIRHAAEYDIDPDRIYAAGHSMGGFVTAHLLAKRRDLQGGVLIAPWDVARTYAFSKTDVDCRRNLSEVLSCGYGWLRDITPEKFDAELSRDTDALRLDKLAPGLRNVPILCISGENDVITPPELHQYPLRDALSDSENFRHVTLPGDHCFQAYRPALWETVGEYLLELER